MREQIKKWIRQYLCTHYAVYFETEDDLPPYDYWYCKKCDKILKRKDLPEHIWKKLDASEASRSLRSEAKHVKKNNTHAKRRK